jgi:hypothetical protein
MGLGKKKRLLRGEKVEQQAKSRLEKSGIAFGLAWPSSYCGGWMSCMGHQGWRSV